jgi:hypothetical protein
MGEVELALKNMLQAEALLLHEGSGVDVDGSGSGGDGDAMLEEDENERLLKVQQYSCIDQRNCELLINTMNLSIQRFCCFCCCCCCCVSKGWSGNTTTLTRYLKQTQQYLEET